MEWLESGAVLVLMMGVAIALRPLVRSRSWPALWLLCLTLLMVLGWVRRNPSWEAWPGLAWLTAGRREYVLYGPLTLLLLGLPGLQVPRRFTRVVLAGLAGLVCLEYSLGPFLGPVLEPPAVATLDPEDICIQNDSFSCGPASAVTVLGRLGLRADFAALARCAHTSRFIGTPPDLLCEAMEQLYPVQAQHLFLENAPQPTPDEQWILVLNLGLFVDHYVALLRGEVSEGVSPSENTRRGEVSEGVWLGDPMLGRVRLSTRDLQRRWRHEVIRVTRRGNGFATPTP